jgi:hypothetical protein
MTRQHQAWRRQWPGAVDLASWGRGAGSGAPRARSMWCGGGFPHAGSSVLLVVAGGRIRHPQARIYVVWRRRRRRLPPKQVARAAANPSVATNLHLHPPPTRRCRRGPLEAGAGSKKGGGRGSHPSWPRVPRSRAGNDARRPVWHHGWARRGSRSGAAGADGRWRAMACPSMVRRRQEVEPVMARGARSGSLEGGAGPLRPNLRGGTAAGELAVIWSCEGAALRLVRHAAAGGRWSFCCLGGRKVLASPVPCGLGSRGAPSESHARHAVGACDSGIHGRRYLPRGIVIALSTLQPRRHGGTMDSLASLAFSR